jgi:predicted RNA-binding protein with PUA-like domain
MAYWLFKSEPETWSWSEQKAQGKAGGEWTGVRNYQARNHMRAMKKGEKGFFYHSGARKEIVGIVEIASTAHPDSTDKTGQWVCVDIRAVRDLKPVSMPDIKAEARLKDMVLVRNSRLSVQPVKPEEWRIICRMGGLAEPP